MVINASWYFITDYAFLPCTHFPILGFSLGRHHTESSYLSRPLRSALFVVTLMLLRKTYQFHEEYPHDTRLGEDEKREDVSFFPSTGRGSCQHGSTLDADLGLAKGMLLKCLPDCCLHTTPYISLLSCGGTQRL